MHEPRPALFELTLARFREFTREPEAIFWVFVFPILLTLALGFAFREKAPDRIPVGVLAGPHAEQRVKALAASPALLARTYTEHEGMEALRRGKISLIVAGVEVPEFRFDPTRPDARTARVEADDALQASAGRRDAFDAKDVHVSEQGSRYVDFLVPGLLGMNLMGTGMWGIGFSIVNARMKKLLKRLVATPMRRSDFLISQFLSRVLFLVLEVTVVIVFAWLVFDVRVRGSIVLFAALCLLGGLTFAALGLLVASRARTIEGANGIMNIVMMPMWLCSGVFFSYERFPDAAKPFIRLLPLTAINDALRAVVNEAAGVQQVLPQIAVLAVWAIVAYTVALKIFRWQ